MGIRWTEEEAIEHGFRKDKKGNWYLPQAVKPGPKSSPNNSRSLPQPKPSIRNETKRSNAPKKTRKKSSQKRLKRASERDYSRFKCDCPRFKIYVKSYRKRHLDPDNLCPKWYIDEIVKAGYLPDDSSKYVESIEKSVEKDSDERTVITVTRIS